MSGVSSSYKATHPPYCLACLYVSLLGRVNVTYMDRDGDTHHIKGKVGDNALYLAHRYDIEMEGIYIEPRPG